MEQNPFSAIANNSIGTYRLVVAALEAGVSRLIAVSTDKAVNPRERDGRVEAHRGVSGAVSLD